MKAINCFQSSLHVYNLEPHKITVSCCSTVGSKQGPNKTIHSTRHKEGSTRCPMGLCPHDCITILSKYMLGARRTVCTASSIDLVKQKIMYIAIIKIFLY